MRRLYVGMTRAKRRLFVHTNGNAFDALPADQYLIDMNQYPMPEEITLQLTHKDVFLDYFKSRKAEVLALRSGMPLRFADNCLYETISDKPVVMLSQKMRDELVEWKKRGYRVADAKVRFIVAWKPIDSPKDEPEYAVLLADLRLTSC